MIQNDDRVEKYDNYDHLHSVPTKSAVLKKFANTASDFSDNDVFTVNHTSKILPHSNHHQQSPSYYKNIDSLKPFSPVSSQGTSSSNQTNTTTHHNHGSTSKLCLNRDKTNKLGVISANAKTCIITILTILNFLNYVDRYTIVAIVESRLKCPFKLEDGDIGFITTSFYLAYMLISPFVGYYGCRMQRKKIITIGVGIWVSSLLLGSQISNPTGNETDQELLYKWYGLLASRAFFGVGEACYICLATAIIHDMYIEDAVRMKMLVIFSMAIPVGSGAGYIVGEQVANYFNFWQSATVCCTPFTLICLIIWCLFCPDVPHGYSDLMEKMKKDGKTGEEILNKKIERRRTYKQSLNEQSNRALVSESDPAILTTVRKPITMPPKPKYGENYIGTY